MNDAETLFDAHRTHLFAIAYRMLGSIMDAEDMVQETFVRWQQAAEPQAVSSPRAYLSAVITRLCIDHLRSARVQREAYVGAWLPEPLVMEQADDTAGMAALADSVSVAFLVLLESLAPAERAAFLLREVFDYSYDEIAGMVETSPANCRQMVHRARQRITSQRPRFEASRPQQERLMRRFLQACYQGNMEGLLAVLAEDITLQSDGGGKVPAARRPIYGASNVARFILGIIRKAPPSAVFRPAEVNGRPGLISYIDGKPYSVLTFDSADDRMQSIYIVANPEKLKHLPPLA